MKPQFEIHEGKLFRMLEEPVPLKEDDENVLVRFITHGVIGEYVMEHWLDCNQKNVPIFVKDVDSDGDVTVCIENGNEHICCPFPMFEIIGTFVEEGSKEWALYQMMQGEKVTKGHLEHTYCHYDARPHLQCISEYICGTLQIMVSPEIWIKTADKDGWQIYVEPEQPKPLLADAKVGDLVKLRNGSYSQIVEVEDGSVFKYQNPEAIERSRVALFLCDENGDTSRWGKVKDVDIIFTEPLAPEGTAEWAWQMLMLRKPVSHPAEGEFQDTDYTKEGFVRCMAKTGWQIYEEPEPQYKAGDFVEIINQYSDTTHLAQIDSIDHEIHIGTHRFDISGKSVMERVPQLSIIRKLKPSQVIVQIGCLSGTVKDLSYVEDGRFWFIGKKTERCPGGMYAILYEEMLDTPTRELVESLIKAQEEK